jgi:hypothetical protein
MDFKMWCLYAMEFYSDVKRNEIASFAGKWMALENFLGEVNQLQKAKVCMFPSYVKHRPNTNTAIF